MAGARPGTKRSDVIEYLRTAPESHQAREEDDALKIDIYQKVTRNSRELLVAVTRDLCQEQWNTSLDPLERERVASILDSMRHALIKLLEWCPALNRSTYSASRDFLNSIPVIHAEMQATGLEDFVVLALLLMRVRPDKNAEAWFGQWQGAWQRFQAGEATDRSSERGLRRLSNLSILYRKTR